MRRGLEVSAKPAGNTRKEDALSVTRDLLEHIGGRLAATEADASAGRERQSSATMTLRRFPDPGSTPQQDDNTERSGNSQRSQRPRSERLQP